MSLISRLMEMTRLNDDDDEDYFGPEDDYELDRPVNSRDDMEEEEEEPRPRFFSRPSPKVVPMRRAEVSMIKPTSIEDAREICDFLLAGKAVVLNMEGIHTEIAQRIIDIWRNLFYEWKPSEDFQLHFYSNSGVSRVVW